uniref:S1 motif domain-containing protein n=1 Tax=Solanum tuberosum TaxID=4113 RepID=M1BN56_SOLTU
MATAEKRFNEALDGVVLTYEPKFSSNLAKILPGIHPYFEGEVVKVGQQSIHIIVLGLSSAVIADEDIQEDFKYKIKHGKEVFVSKSHKNHRIKVGTTLRFVVKK